MAMPLALALLGMENRKALTPENNTSSAAPDATRQAVSRDAMRIARASRRPTSHYNSFQTACAPSHDNPPSYAIATRQRVPDPPQLHKFAKPPSYTCTVVHEGRLQLSLESISPLSMIAEIEWREVYVVLQGTMLSLHRVKDGGAGRLLRTYTLQHAEIGLAVDTTHDVLLPQTRLAHLIPSSARRKAWTKDPDMFKIVNHTILRLRAETDQILLADASEDCIFEWMHTLSAAIDISNPIDDRSIPRQCTVPRRRRRRTHLTLASSLVDSAFLAEQERILRNMYPGFAERSEPSLTRTATTATTEDAAAEPAQMAGREEDELDLSVMREDFAASSAESAPSRETTDSTSSSSNEDRPVISRHTTSSSIASANAADDGGMTYATNPANLTSAGKWEPLHPRTAAQALRCERRCMPILNSEAPRASDVLICNGKRVKVNWRMELLEEWELKPPSYRHHREKPLERSQSQTSGAGSPASTSVLGSGSEQEQSSTNQQSLELTKVNSSTTTAAGDKLIMTVAESSHSDNKTPKIRPARPFNGDSLAHGAAFCF